MTEHFKLWFKRKNGLEDKVKMTFTYKNYERHVRQFIVAEQSRLDQPGGQVPNLDRDILNFGGQDLVWLPFLDLHRDLIQKPGTRRMIFHQAYLQLVRCAEEFLHTKFLKLLRVERHLQRCRASCVAATSSIQREVKDQLSKNKEKKQRDGHLSENPDRCVELIKLYRTCTTLQNIQTSMDNKFKSYVAHAGREGQLKVSLYLTRCAFLFVCLSACPSVCRPPVWQTSNPKKKMSANFHP